MTFRSFRGALPRVSDRIGRSPGEIGPSIRSKRAVEAALAVPEGVGEPERETQAGAQEDVVRL